ARALQAVQLGRALGLLDADAGEVGELLLDALAALLPLGLEGGGDAGLPVGQVAAVSVGVDDVGPEASHGSSPQWPPPSPKTPRARRPASRSGSARSKSSRGERSVISSSMRSRPARERAASRGRARRGRAAP